MGKLDEYLVVWQIGRGEKGAAEKGKDRAEKAGTERKEGSEKSDGIDVIQHG